MDFVNGTSTCFLSTLESLILTALIEWLDVLRSNLSASQLRTLYNFVTAINTSVTYAIDYALALASTITGASPSLATIALLVFILFISLNILNMLWKWVKWWVDLALRLVFWGGLIFVVAWVWSRGPDGFVEDLQGLMAYYNEEYRFYGQKAKMEQRMWARAKKGWW